MQKSLFGSSLVLFTASALAGESPARPEPGPQPAAPGRLCNPRNLTPGSGVQALRICPPPPPPPLPVEYTIRTQGLPIRTPSLDGRDGEARVAGMLDGIAMDPSGNLYFGEAGRIRVLRPDGSIVTAAGVAGQTGSVDGVGNSARLHAGRMVSDDTGAIYFIQIGTAVRKLFPDGRVLTLAGSPASSGTTDGIGGAARFTNLTGITLAPDGDLYLTQRNLGQIRRVRPDGTVTTLILTSGPAPLNPVDLTADGGGRLWVSDQKGGVILRLTLTGGDTAISEVFGGRSQVYGNLDGPIGQSRLTHRLGAIEALAGGDVYFVDHAWLKAIDGDGSVRTVAGGAAGLHDGSGAQTALSDSGDANDLSMSGGILYLTDYYRPAIRRITPDGKVTTLAGDYLPSVGVRNSPIRAPWGVIPDGQGGYFYTQSGGADVLYGSGVWRVPEGEAPRVHAGGAGVVLPGWETQVNFTLPRSPALAPDGTLYVPVEHSIRVISPTRYITRIGSGVRGYNDGAPDAARFDGPSAVVRASDGTLYVADTFNNLIRMITPDGQVSLYAGRVYYWGTDPQGNPVWKGYCGNDDGARLQASFCSPISLALAPDGSLYIGESRTHLLRRLAPDGQVSTLAGVPWLAGQIDGPAASALLSEPAGLLPQPDGSLWFTDASTLRKLTTDGQVVTIAGLADEPGMVDGPLRKARFNQPKGIARDADGSLLIADSGNHRIRRLNAAGLVSTVLEPVTNFQPFDGPPGTAQNPTPSGAVPTGDGAIWFTDSINKLIRWMAPDGRLSTFSGRSGEPMFVDGTLDEARFYSPSAPVLMGDGSLLVLDAGRIRRLSKAEDLVETVYFGMCANYQYCSPRAYGLGPDGRLYFTSLDRPDVLSAAFHGDGIGFVGDRFTSGHADGAGTQARFSNPDQIAVTPSGMIYVLDLYTAAVGYPTCLRRITPAGEVTTIELPILGTDTLLLASDGGDGALVLLKSARTLWKVGADGSLRQVAGRTPVPVYAEDGTGTAAAFESPVTLASYGVRIVITDSSARGARFRTGLPAAPFTDTAAIDSATGPIGETRQLGVIPESGTRYRWSIVQRPTTSAAELSDAASATPVFLPDTPAIYTFRVVAEAGESLRSSQVSLAAGCPSAVTNPLNVTACEGGDGSFSVAATGAALHYQWRRDGVPLADGTKYQGALTPNLTVRGVATADHGSKYDVVVSNGCGSRTSTQAALNVTRPVDGAAFLTLAQKISGQFDYVWDFVDGGTTIRISRCNGFRCAPAPLLLTGGEQYYTEPLGNSRRYHLQALNACGESAPSQASFQNVLHLKNSSNGNSNYLALPYTTQYPDAASLWNDLPPARLNLYHWDQVTATFQRYAGGGLGQVNFPITPGEGYILAMSGDADWIVVGTHDDTVSIPLRVYTDNGYDATNLVSLPYHSDKTNAAGLCAEVPQLTLVSRWDAALGGRQSCACNASRDGCIGIGTSDNFSLTPGEALILNVSADVEWIPAHN